MTKGQAFGGLRHWLHPNIVAMIVRQRLASRKDRMAGQETFWRFTPPGSRKYKTIGDSLGR